MGDQADDIFLSFELTEEEEETDYQQVKNRLESEQSLTQEINKRVNLWTVSSLVMASQDTAILMH